MAEQLPKWDAVGVEPPTVLKTDGWQPGMKPSAQHMNWLFNRIYKCLEEIQLTGGTEEIQQELTALQELVTAHQAEKASKTGFGHVQIGDGINVTDGVISVAEMTATNVSTTSGSNVQTEIDNLKSSVSNGKLDVRNAITGKGGTVADADGDGVPTHAELAAGVTGLTTPKTDDGIIADEASLSYGVNMWGDFAYNNEADERVVIAYNNGTGAIYRGIVYEKNGQFYRETSNINAAINAVQRDELNIFLATNSNSIMAYPIDLMTTYKWIRTNYLTFGKMLRHKGKLICLENGSYYVRVLNTETGETEKSYLSPSTIGAMTIDDDGYLYIFDTSATVKKIDLLGLKSDNSVVWSVSGITVNGSGPTDIILSSNHVFAVTTAGQVTKMRKTDGLVIGNKNFGLNQTRIFFDRYDNTFTWVNGSQTIMFRGKETVEGGLRSFNTVGYNYRPVGNRRIYTGVGSNFKTMSIFYKT